MVWSNPLPLRLLATADSESFRSMPIGYTGLPLAGHPGAFSHQRKHHTHEGVDLYCEEGTPVYAVEDGEVVAVIPFTGIFANPMSPWWKDTWAVLVEGESGVVVYGEIHADVSEGDQVKAGQKVGEVCSVLVKDKGRPMAMLHLELHKPGTRDAYEWIDERPESLLDPTPYLQVLVDEHPDSAISNMIQKEMLNGHGEATASS